jgi:integrase
LNRFFGSVILHEITSHRIEQFKRDRLNGTWRAFKQRAARPVKPGTVNRELDTLKSILSKAIEWKYLVDSPARGVKRFRLENRRTRILSADEQRRLLDACERTPKLQALLKLALMTGARIGELLTLRWEDCEDGYLTFWETKNGKVRRIPSRRRSPPCWPPGREFTMGLYERED